jgi:hypothetical protein
MQRFTLSLIFRELNTDLRDLIIVPRLFLLIPQKLTIEELLGDDACCDAVVHLQPISPSIQCHLSYWNISYSSHWLDFIPRSLALAQCYFPSCCSCHTAHIILTRTIFVVLLFSPPTSWISRRYVALYSVYNKLHICSTPFSHFECTWVQREVR